MYEVKFSKEQIEALRKDFQLCVDSSMVDGKFNAYAFFGAVETCLNFLSADGSIYIYKEVSCD